MNRTDRGISGYDRLARMYRPLEYSLFGNQLQRARVGLIDALPDVHRVRVLGDGDGRFLEAFCRVQPRAEVESLDFSPVMLSHQRRRLAMSVPGAHVRFRQQNARHLSEADEAVDLLVCNFFLDCFSAAELEALLPRWLAALKPRGWFYFCDFVIPQTGWWRLKSAIDQYLMHRLFRWQTGLVNRRLPDLDAALKRQPLSLRMTATGLIPMVTCRLYRHESGLPDDVRAVEATG